MKVTFTSNLLYFTILPRPVLPVFIALYRASYFSSIINTVIRKEVSFLSDIYPLLMRNFHCKAGACQHTCCQKWEIDIDDATAAYYQSLNGDIGNHVRHNMYCDDDGWHFKLTEQERCGLLRNDGLCQLILDIGEGALCQICTDHPRFYVDVDDYTLCGVGLSCEASVELLVEQQEPLLFAVDHTDWTGDFPALLDFLGFSLPKSHLYFHPTITHIEYASILADLAITEPIDEAWTQDVKRLQANVDTLLDSSNTYKHHYNLTVFNNIYHYIFYRQLDKAFVYGIEAIAIYARRSTDYIFLMAALSGDVHESIRRWSEQIEYDTDNVDWLLERLL